MKELLSSRALLTATALFVILSGGALNVLAQESGAGVAPPSAARVEVETKRATWPPAAAEGLAREWRAGAQTRTQADAGFFGAARPSFAREAVGSPIMPAVSGNLLRQTSQSPGGVNPQQDDDLKAPNTITPLTPGEKMERAFRSAFLSPQAYLFPAINATITQLREEDQPHKDTEDEVADALSRFARNFATRSTKSVLSNGVYPVLFRQDPRYYPSGKKGFGARALYAASRVFVTYGDAGDTQPNYSRLAGTITAHSLANLWERDTPGRRRIGAGPTFRRVAWSLGFDAISNVLFREFGREIFRR